MRSLVTRIRTLHRNPRSERPALRDPGLRRELRSRPTVLLILFCLLVGLPVAILLTPAQEVVAFGQHIAVGARPPEPNLSGPARLVQVGNTALDIDRIQVYGPLRPQITLGPMQRNAASEAMFDPQAGPAAAAAAVQAVTDGFLTWYVLGGLGLLAFALVSAAAAAGIRTLLVVRAQSRAGADHQPLADIWAYCVRAAGRMTVLATTVSALAWLACGWLAYDGAAGGLQGVNSLTQLVGVRHVSPPPAGPALIGFKGAVIGDSRAARVGGPPVGERGDRADDAVCARSSDSLAVEIGQLMPSRVLNLACPDATVTEGLLGPQVREGVTLPPQIASLKQLQGLEFVVVVIGPNDVGWTDFLRYCYGVAECDDALTEGEFTYRLAAFDQAFGQLLAELNDLPGRPQVIVTTSYDVFPPGSELDPACPDLRFPGTPGLDARKVDLFAARNAQLNEVLTTGAEKYGFSVARPALRPLCTDGTPELGPDLQGIDNPNAFHPTGVGSLRIASAVVRLIAPNATS
ncbi:GDSL-like Lipase/Acylhydrolase family protein [Pseudonocardia thermophila]|uniref:GDSL-like Lipase/Acylhydrolase family protein n=1 Tax=Pseudonocardia thermophila TaxID=1848 RepID=A0A1M6NPB9_PSETH|nr:GDSL-type esterase/lipase family protein [Pseudonocardia thermophila]SHJ97514.1 GDSL-like Lipase/Acylhydrolase family protein [Pseudonocardia thermophila]